MLDTGGPITPTQVDAWRAAVAASRFDADHSDSALLELIESAEQLKDACAALQARATHEFSERRLAALAPGSKPDREARHDIAARIARARHVSPVQGQRHLELSRMLVLDLPRTLDALSAGQTTEYRTSLIAHAAVCLGTADRAALDTDLGPRLAGKGNRSVQAEADRLAAELDAAAVVERHRLAAKDRRVTLRPAPDTMTYLTALLPVADGVATWAALDRHATLAKAAGDRRSRGQLMADELRQRLLHGSSSEPEAIGATSPTTASTDPSRPAPDCRIPATGVDLRPAVGALGRGTLGSGDQDVVGDVAGPQVIATHARPEGADALPGDDAKDSDSARPSAHPDTDLPPTADRPAEDGRDNAAGRQMDALLGPPSPAPTGVPSPHPNDASRGPHPDAPPPSLPALPPVRQIDLMLVMTDRALLDGADTAAVVPGFGPVPAALARGMLADADRATRVFIRRLYTDPAGEQLLSADARGRLFPHAVRQFVLARDQRCRTPFCDAPIRHIDHTVPHSVGGPTRLGNSGGLCERCSLTKGARTDAHAQPGPPPLPPRSASWATVIAREVRDGAALGGATLGGAALGGAP